MKKNINFKVAIIGDTILEFNSNTKQFNLGGAGNVAKHLNLWTPTLYFIPGNIHQDIVNHILSNSEDVKDLANRVACFEHYSKFYIDKGIGRGLHSCTPNLNVPLRIWKDNKVTYKFNSPYFQADKDYSLKKFHSKIIKKLITENINTVYLEWHFPNSYCLSFVEELNNEIKYSSQQEKEKVKKWIKNLTVYLDSRVPERIPFKFFKFPFKELYWKMNDQELIKMCNKIKIDSLDKWSLSSFEKKVKFKHTILHTSGRKGCAILYKDDVWSILKIKPTDHSAVQSCGCGDSFFSTFLGVQESKKNLTLEQKLKVASVAGGLAASKPYVELITPSEIKKYLQSSQLNYYKDDQLLNLL
tara:strand:- start:579 stop:1649 length:1071 start_codon:yes stop_codon:yes gene_type:complete